MSGVIQIEIEETIAFIEPTFRTSSCSTISSIQKGRFSLFGDR